jgi:hypothetical protein
MIGERFLGLVGRIFVGQRMKVVWGSKISNYSMSLLAKWHWRLLADPIFDWSKVLVAKYGEVRRPLLVVHNSKSLFVVEGFSGSWEE